MTNMKNTTKTMLFTSLIVVAVMTLGGVNSTYAMNYSSPEDLSEIETVRITTLAKQVQFLDEIIKELSDGNVANKSTILYLQGQLDKILEELNLLGFYTPTQFKAEKIVEMNTITESNTLSCCTNEMGWRAGFQYKLWGVMSDTRGAYQYSTVLDVPKTSTASIGYFVPDWVKPYAEAFQTPSSGGDIEYTLQFQNGADGPIIDYDNNIKTVLSTSWWTPSQWAEAKYYNINQYDKVVMVGNADSWN